MKLALRGAAAAVAIALVALVAAAYGLEASRFTPTSIVAFRILVLLAVALGIGFLLVRPLFRTVSDEQVALYLEEHEPSLQAAIVSAVAANRSGDPTASAASPALVSRLVEAAIEQCSAIDAGRGIERAPLWRHTAMIAAACLVAFTVFTFGPAYVRSALSALLLVSRSVEAAVPYRVEVAPGHVTLPKGADQTIAARLHGFSSDQATLMVRKTPTEAFERLPLVAAGPDRFEGMVFDLAGPVDYYVESAGVRSPVFTLKVVDLPYVRQLELEYHFPSYTGLAPRKIPDGGDCRVARHGSARPHHPDDEGSGRKNRAPRHRRNGAGGGGRRRAHGKLHG
jgi:hypothetical protein